MQANIAGSFPFKKGRSFLLIIFLVFSALASANSGIIAGMTLVLERGQYPAGVKLNPVDQVYVLYRGSPFMTKSGQGTLFRGDTIINYKKFSAAYPSVQGFRLIFTTGKAVDSLWQMDADFRVTDKAYNLGDGLLHVLNFDSTMKKIDEFIFNYAERLAAVTNTRGNSGSDEPKTLDWLLRRFQVISSSDRNMYAVGSVWIISIGIDDYGPRKYKACKSDAVSYTDYFGRQYARGKDNAAFSKLIHKYLLLDKDATKEGILAALKEIATKSTFNDYFIFNFSGQSYQFPDKSGITQTYFFPYNVTGDLTKPANRDQGDSSDVLANMISLNQLQEHIQAIPANNQLFISEAGPSGKFKTEFIKSLMQHSPEIAGILNKNRVIIVPNGTGMDGVVCNGQYLDKGPINYFVTSLDTANIYDLFKDEYYANKIAYYIRNKAYTCNSFGFEYFDIFFERKFIREYNELFSSSGQSRGLKPKPKELRQTANLDGKQHALIVGTDTYKGEGWKKLPNAVHDARAVSDILEQSYGFEVQLLENKPLDTIYKAIGEYYRTLAPNDQLIIYFSGHGDMETEFMDDGFIVCTDSKAREDDPTRNTYIQYVKLQKMVNKIPARQILVMLDVCHGGVFNQKRSDPVKTIANRNVHQFLSDQASFICRKFLSSVGTDEAFDGKPGEHSPFANLLLQVLRAKGGSSNGIVTLSNIYSVLQTASMNETATLKISPQKDGFGGDNPESEFILIPVERSQAQE